MSRRGTKHRCYIVAINWYWSVISIFFSWHELGAKSDGNLAQIFGFGGEYWREGNSFGLYFSNHCSCTPSLFESNHEKICWFPAHLRAPAGTWVVLEVDGRAFIGKMLRNRIESCRLHVKASQWLLLWCSISLNTLINFYSSIVFGQGWASYMPTQRYFLRWRKMK